MRLIRFQEYGAASPSWGIVDGTTIHKLPDVRSVTDIASALESGSLTPGENISPQSFSLLPPAEPCASIYCVGLNYRDHAEEMRLVPPTRPVFFARTRASLFPSGGGICHPGAGTLLDYEAELAIVIAKPIGPSTTVTWENLHDHCLGFTLMNDCTARDIQLTEDQWFNAKNFRGFAPLGPELNLLNPETVAALKVARLVLSVAQASEPSRHILRQESPVSAMLFSIPELINFLAERCDLFPGDIISTGTPAGIAMNRPPRRETGESDSDFFVRLHRFLDDERKSNRKYLQPGDTVRTSLLDRNSMPVIAPLHYTIEK